MTCGKNYKTIDIKKIDSDYIDEIRKTPLGNISYADVFHTIVLFWKENH